MLRLLSIFSTLLLIIIFLFFYKRNREKRLWVIFLYICLSLTTDISYNLLKNSGKIAQFYLYSYFTIVEFTIITIFFAMVYKTRAFKWLLAGGFGIFLTAAIYSLNYNNTLEFDSLPASVECILVIIYSILFFYEQINNPEVTFIYSSKNFWIIVGFFVYLASTLFLFIVAAYMSMADMEKFWFINFIANILKNILFGIAFSLPSGKKPIHPVKKKRNLQ